MLFYYATSFVSRYAHSPAILMWEVRRLTSLSLLKTAPLVHHLISPPTSQLGNELNLEADLCPDPEDGRRPEDCFSTAEALAFLKDYRKAVREADFMRRLVNTGMAFPRPAAHHMMTEECGSPHYWSNDTAEETGVILDLYYADQDLVSMHFYGCVTSSYSYCTGVANMTVYDVAKAASSRLGKPLYVGEFGASNAGPNDGYNATNSKGVRYFEAATHAIAMRGIPLSTMWAWVCPSHGDTPNWYVVEVWAWNSNFCSLKRCTLGTLLCGA